MVKLVDLDLVIDLIQRIEDETSSSLFDTEMTIQNYVSQLSSLRRSEERSNPPISVIKRMIIHNISQLPWVDNNKNKKDVKLTGYEYIDDMLEYIDERIEKFKPYLSIERADFHTSLKSLGAYCELVYIREIIFNHYREQENVKLKKLSKNRKSEFIRKFEQTMGWK